MSFQLPNLPYAMDALQPHLSKETLEYHYGKHHKTYVDKLNVLVEGKPEAKKSLEELILESQGAVFNNAAQIWNHTFYWQGLAPNAGGEPQGSLAKAIHQTYGSFADFQKQFSEAAVNLFGSGWAWLVKRRDGGLAIVQTKDAGNPLTSGDKPVLTCDVWEHAYYIDYRNARAKYVETYWKMVNWNYAAKQFEA